MVTGQCRGQRGTEVVTSRAAIQVLGWVDPDRGERLLAVNALLLKRLELPAAAVPP